MSTVMVCASGLAEEINQQAMKLAMEEKLVDDLLQVSKKAVENWQKAEQQRDELLAAINDVLDGTPIDELNRDDDGMLSPWFRGRGVGKWAKRLESARNKATENWMFQKG